MEDLNSASIPPNTEGEHSYHDSSQHKSHLLDYEYTIHTIKVEPRNHVLWNFHSCKLCPYKTKSFFIMRSHLRRHKVTRFSKKFSCSNANMDRYKCNSCDYRTLLLVNFNRHIEVSHRREIEIKLEKGNESGNSAPLIFSNFNWVNMLKSYSCESCEFKTYSQLLYVAHYRKCPLNAVVHHNSLKPSKAYDKEFLRWHKFNKQKTIEELKFQCSMCPYRAKRKTTLDGHLRVKHPFPKNTFNKNASYKLLHCAQCSYTSKYKFSLERHTLAKHPSNQVTWYNCKDCQYKTSWHHNMYSHIRRGHPKKKKTAQAKKVVSPQKTLLECPKCPFKSHVEIAYSNHILFKHASDEDTKWYNCKQCRYKTIFAANLEKHTLKVHSPLFSCNICPFQGKKAVLKRHIVQKHFHASERKHVVADSPKLSWFKCESCAFKSTEQVELKEHILEQHIASESVVCFKCQLCTFRTIESIELKEHILEKHVDPQNTDWCQCEMCDCKFRETLDLKKHILEKHIL